jgi:DNA-binding response OmpR family regulator
MLDIWMSGYDGRDICRQLKNDPEFSKIPILMISASRDIRQSAIDAGANDFMEKPFEMDSLLNKVEVLPWDVWGVQPQKDEELTPDQIKLFDTIADLTVDPDRTFADLRKTYERDDLRVPPTVFNALLERTEEL